MLAVGMAAVGAPVQAGGAAERGSVSPADGAAPAAAGTAGNVVWLCRPGQQPNPCRWGRDTSVVGSDGTVTPAPRQAAERKRFDCFFVYPTVSEQPGMVADKTIDPEIAAVARHEASRFSDVCRVYAPVYRQVTIAGLMAALEGRLTATEVAGLLDRGYRDVQRAWRAYRQQSDGRPVAVIGHSQGSLTLLRLLQETVEPRPKLRQRLVSALLIGWPVAVKKGKDVGGDFRKIPACTKAGQANCIISYSSYGESIPDDPFYGVVDRGARESAGTTVGSKYEAMCTNPAALSGGSARLAMMVPKDSFAEAGFFLGADLSAVTTNWITPADDFGYEGGCVTSNGANVLQVRPIAPAKGLFDPTLPPTWGLHLLDELVVSGDLVDRVKASAKTVRKALRKRR